MTVAPNKPAILTDQDITDIVRAALDGAPDAKRILVLTTDYSRLDFTDRVFRAIHDRIRARPGGVIDVLNTAGTHRQMKQAEWVAKLGGEPRSFAALRACYEHHFDDPDELIEVGTLPAEFLRVKTAGYVDEPLAITVNKRIAEGYDLVIGINGTVPHEGTGFSGGQKIIFPGIAGPQVTGAFHWAAVLIGIPNLIGTRENPARDIVNAAAQAVFDHISPTPVLSFNMVYTSGENDEVVPNGLFGGFGTQGFNAAHALACKLSAQLHIVYVDHPLDVVVQCIPAAKYDEWWTAMKGSYKLQRAGLLNPGAEVILLAPHIHQFHSNATMDAAIREIGYHGRDHVAEYVRRHPTFDKNVASHVINARGIGRLVDGLESFDFRLSIASAVSPEQCAAVGLGYRDPATIRPEDFTGPGKLWIEHGGQDLYALRS
ncbi:MAG: lactate racemase domain-containing protein [Bdellovibrionota bacterium]